MIRLFAYLFMFLDHVGFIILHDSFIFRLIGRLSMPLFAFGIAQGFYFTSRKGTLKNYALRVFLLALFSQIPFYLAGFVGLNICFTWCLALLLLYSFTKNLKSGCLILICISFFELLFIYLGIPLYTDYAIYGVTLPLFFYYAFFVPKIKKEFILPLFVGLCGLHLLVEAHGSLLQLFSLLSLPIISFCQNKSVKFKFPKWLVYSFYPLHLLILVIIRFILEGVWKI